MSCHPPTIHLPRQPAQEILKDEDNVNDCIVEGEKFEFRCTDICYIPKTIRETAVSLFIFSPRTSIVSNFINKINCLKRGCKYERVGDSDQMISENLFFIIFCWLPVSLFCVNVRICSSLHFSSCDDLAYLESR